jgi:two-component system, OmpR family, response regulator RegX3
VNRRGLLAPGPLDALHLGVLITDSRGRPVRANAAAQRLLGCQADGAMAPKEVLALAGEAQHTGTACDQELVLGQAAVRVHAVPLDGGAVVELDDVSSARRLQQAYRDLLAAIGDTLLAGVEPLGLLVELLSAADDPSDAARVLQQLRADANALVGLVGSPTPPKVDETAPVNGAITGPRPRGRPARGGPLGVLDQPSVLLVHPAGGLIGALTIGLSQAGLSVIAAHDIQEALKIVETVTPDAMVLDCAASGPTVADAYSKLRTVTQAPMVLLERGNEKLAELVGDSAGDAVVLRRPLRLGELLTAIEQAVASQRNGRAVWGSDVLAVGDVVLDERAHAVRVRDEPVEMPIKEFELLRVLLAHAGRAISRERMIELVWGTDFAVGRRNLHTHIKRLRQKIERDPTSPQQIVTIRGFGYRFSAPGRGGP